MGRGIAVIDLVLHMYRRSPTRRKLAELSRVIPVDDHGPAPLAEGLAEGLVELRGRLLAHAAARDAARERALAAGSPCASRHWARALEAWPRFLPVDSGGNGHRLGFFGREGGPKNTKAGRG